MVKKKIHWREIQLDLVTVKNGLEWQAAERMTGDGKKTKQNSLSTEAGGRGTQ